MRIQRCIRRSSRSDGLAKCGNFKLRNISNFEGMLFIFLVELQQQVEANIGIVHNRHQATVHRGCPIAPAQAKGTGWKDMLGVQHA